MAKPLVFIAALGVVVTVVAVSVKADGLAVAGRAGTLGLGAEVTKGFTETVNGRFGLNNYTFDKSAAQDGVNYDIDMELENIGAFVDWHPFRGSFRTTAGIVHNGNGATLKAQSASSYEIGSTTYTGAEVGELKGDLGFDSMSPYVGVGWGNAVDKKGRWTFGVDVGALFQGGADLQLSTNGQLASDSTFQSNLETERQRAQDDLGALEVYPVVQAGLGYRF